MATWDSADLLARVKTHGRIPVTREFPTDTQIYDFLTEAQREWVGVFAAMVPWAMMGAPTLMSSADNGATYTFSGGATPLAVEVYDATNGRLLIPGAYWDEGADYVWEGTRIRMTRGQTRTFAAGPYARYVSQPTVIDGSTAPTLVPDYTRILLVYRALIKSGNTHQDWQAREDKAWLGNPLIGDPGILGTLKMQNPFQGMASHRQAATLYGLSYIAQVEGYTGL